MGDTVTMHRGSALFLVVATVCLRCHALPSFPLACDLERKPCSFNIAGQNSCCPGLECQLIGKTHKANYCVDPQANAAAASIASTTQESKVTALPEDEWTQPVPGDSSKVPTNAPTEQCIADDKPCTTHAPPCEELLPDIWTDDNGPHNTVMVANKTACCAAAKTARTKAGHAKNWWTWNPSNTSSDGTCDIWTGPDSWKTGPGVRNPPVPRSGYENSMSGWSLPPIPPGSLCCQGSVCFRDDTKGSICVHQGTTTHEEPEEAQRLLAPCTDPVKAYDQCGGTTWSGSTCCDKGYSCTGTDKYKECEPPKGQCIAVAQPCLPHPTNIDPHPAPCCDLDHYQCDHDSQFCELLQPLTRLS